MGVWFTGLQHRLAVAAIEPRTILSYGTPLVMGRVSSTVFNHRRKLWHYLGYCGVQELLTPPELLMVIKAVPECMACRTTGQVPPISRDMNEKLLKRFGPVCNIIQLKLNERAKDLLPGGRYHNPSAATRARLRTAPSNNDASERSFGSLKYILHASPNMTLINARNIVLLRTNNTLPELLKLPVSEQRRQLSVARSMRVTRQQENRQHERGVLIAKAAATRVNRDKCMAAQGKRDEKKMKARQIIQARSMDEVIISYSYTCTHA